ncbi:tetratricopeptide repeat protein [Deinococcus radiomollis]|uniref:tetratricopeptide repeat protein n=1 Tax=Deinococcus radiomollis TaxID=468916 RepID=UPI003891803E
MTELSAEAWAAFQREDWAAAEKIFREILSTPALIQDESRQAWYGLGSVLACAEQFAEAREIFASLGQRAAARGDPAFEHVALHQLGMVERLAGNWAAAQQCFEHEREMIARLGNSDLAVAVNAYELGTVAQHLGEQAEAKVWLDLSLARAERTDDLIAVGCAHRGLGDWLSAQGQEEEARRRWQAAHASFLRARDEKAAFDIGRRLHS